MKKLTAKEKEQLDKEAQVFRCLICDSYEVRWNGEAWECGECGFIHGNEICEFYKK